MFKYSPKSTLDGESIAAEGNPVYLAVTLDTELRFGPQVGKMAATVG